MSIVEKKAAPQVRIKVFSTYISIPANRNGMFADIRGGITRVLDALKLTRFDPRRRISIPIWRFYIYDTQKDEFRLPRYALDKLTDDLKDQHIQYEIEQVDPIYSPTIDIPEMSSWVDREDQVAAIDFLSDTSIGAMRGTELATGTGKEIPMDSKIRVPNGWKLNRNIEVGDEVVLRDGTVGHVLGVYPQGVKDEYVVQFEDGRFTPCGLEHLWTVYSNTDHDWVTYTTRELIDLIKGDTYYIPLIDPEDNPDVPLPIDAWQLGNMLGDPNTRLNIDIWSTELTELGLFKCEDMDKFIPQIYLNAGRRQREQLLKSILKNVTTLSENHYRVNSTKLATDIQSLAWSLGMVLIITSDNEFHIPSHADLGLKIVDIQPGGRCEMQCITVDSDDSLYVVDDYITTHNTACAIRSALKIQKPTMVICSGLIEQWTESFLKITRLKEEDIYVIKGYPTLKKLFKEGKHYKVYISSIETLRNYILNADSVYVDLPTYEEFLVLFQIGVKIIDEFHLQFAAINTIDLRSNVENNLYLSATPERAEKQADKIFKIVFPYKYIYGTKMLDKYTRAFMYEYRIELPYQSTKYLTTNYGYSHVNYEGLICSDEAIRSHFIKNILIPLVDAYYINEFSVKYPDTKCKCLILVQTVQMAEILQQYLAYNYPDKIVNTYLGKDPIDNLRISDIIISTPKSCGVGKDVADLCCTINTISIGSKPLVAQIFGRLRKLKDGRVPVFVDIYNTYLPQHKYHARTREYIYKDHAATYEHIRSSGN